MYASLMRCKVRYSVCTTRGGNRTIRDMIETKSRGHSGIVEHWLAQCATPSRSCPVSGVRPISAMSSASGGC